MNKFAFDLGQKVVISISGEVGFVEGRAEYCGSECQYLVQYKSADGRAVESWWCQRSLSEAL